MIRNPIQFASCSVGLIFALLLPLAAMQTPGAAAGEIVGTVVSIGTSAPVPRARLTLSTISGHAVTTRTTAIDGRFAIADVPPGEYRIAASQDGFVSNGRGMPVTVVSGAKTEVSVGLAPHGAISGRVVDWDGIPIVGSKVQAMTFALDSRGRRVLSAARSAETNDLGEYRLYWLPPGQYFVNADVSVSGDTPMMKLTTAPQTFGQRWTDLASSGLVATYFPNAVDTTGATRIDIRSGETLTGADIRLVELRKRGISGVVSVSSIRGSTIVELTPRNPASGIRSVTTSADRTGAFRFFGIVPGSYVLTAEATNSDGDEAFGRVLVDIGDRDIENLSVMLTPGFDLRVRLTIDGRTRQSGDPQLVVNLRPMISDTPFPTVERNGDSELMMHHVMLGDYSVGIIALTGLRTPDGAPLNGGLYMKSAQFGGVDVLTSGLHIEGPTSGVLDIVMADGAGSLSGIVKDDRNQPASGVNVVLVPEPQLRGRSDLYKTVRSDASGKFEMSGITPGQYKAYSWEVAEQGEWQYPEFMSLYEDRGQTVRIDNGKRDPVTLQLIPPR